MQELIKIETTPAQIVGNFDEVEAQLTEYLRRYDVVVTAETVADAKKLATELNKQIGELDQRIKDALAEAGAPIREADERRKQLVQLGKDVRLKIKQQVDRFEDETRALASNLLFALRDELWSEHGVDDEFRRAEYLDLVKLTAITKKGNLSKASSDALEACVRDDKALQDRTERRLAQLSSKSYEAGLAAPLTRDHVQHFLFADAEQYGFELQRILDAEVERQAKAEQRLREQAEREAKQKAEAERKEIERKARMTATPAPAPANQEQNIPENIPDAAEQVPERSSTAPRNGKVRWAVVCTFMIEVGPDVTPDAIKLEAEAVMKKAGITTLKNVTAQRA